MTGLAISSFARAIFMTRSGLKVRESNENVEFQAGLQLQ
jgi:hypothetical protein